MTDRGQHDNDEPTQQDPLGELLEWLRSHFAIAFRRCDIRDLWILLFGYRYARFHLNLPLTEQEEELQHFENWIHQRFQDSTTRHWDDIIFAQCQDKQEAFRCFFLLLDEFRKNRN